MEPREVMKELDSCSSQIDSAYLRIARAYGLTYNELMLLYVIAEEGTATQKQAADALFLSRSSVHTILRSLERKGFLVLVEGRNLKEKNITFTPDGKERMARIERVTEDVESAALEAVNPHDLAIVLEAAKAVAQRMSDAAQRMLTEETRGDTR